MAYIYCAMVFKLGKGLRFKMRIAQLLLATIIGRFNYVNVHYIFWRLGSHLQKVTCVVNHTIVLCMIFSGGVSCDDISSECLCDQVWLCAWRHVGCCECQVRLWPFELGETTSQDVMQTQIWYWPCFVIHVFMLLKPVRPFCRS